MNGMADLSGKTLQCNLTMWDVLSHVTLWILVSIVTFGVGLMFWPFAAAQMVADSVVILDDSGKKHSKIRCNINVMVQASVVGLWLLIIMLGGTWLYILSVVIAATFAIPFGIYSSIDHQLMWIVDTAFMLVIAYPFYVWSAVRTTINHSSLSQG